MQRFSVISGATNVFAKRERRGVLLAATLAYILVAFGAVLLSLAVFGGQLIAIAGVFTQAEENPLAVIEALTGVLAWLALVGFVFWLAFAAWEAAALRWLIRGEVGGLLGLKLDGDTLNVWLCQLTFIPVALIIYAIGGVVFGIGWIARNAMGGGLGGGLAVFVATLLALAVVITLFLKFIPASALSVARRRYAFFESWNATTGRALDLFGGLLLIIAVYVAFALLLWIVQSVGLFAAGGSAALAGDPASLLAIGPTALLIAVIGAIASTVAGAIYQLALWGLLAALATDATPREPPAMPAPREPALGGEAAG